MPKRSGFVAYPGAPHEVAATIREAVELANRQLPALTLHTWEHNDVAGRPLTLPILTGIDDAEILIADVTRLNFNVSYEVGFAIGRQRRVLLIRNSSISSDDTLSARAGIFDTLGYATYADSNELLQLLTCPIDSSPLRLASEIDSKAPVYLIETPVRTPDMMRIVARVKRARLFYRSFTPSEDVRLSAVDAIRHVSSSMGIIAPLLSTTYDQAFAHNIRAAFVAGLSHGMGKETLVLQDGRCPAPLDLRDAAETYMSLEDIHRHIERFAGNVYEALQRNDPIALPVGNALQMISLGDPMAENEFQTLSEYYVQTDEYSRALRGEVNLVVGRKGTGKTALFFQVRDRIRRDRQNVVIDLKPEGYQLLKLKEQVLDLLSEGAKSHLITAFWEYLLLLEICRKLLEKDRPRIRYDSALGEEYRNLEKLLAGGSRELEGDFSERLQMLSQHIIDAYQRQYQGQRDVRLTTDEVTNLLHSTAIAELRSALISYLGHKEQVLVLFDNLDKGWSYRGVGVGDILILRCLMDAARKVQKDIRKANIQFTCIVFVRNDIYQLLMDSSPDFGKESRASLDWSDSDLLREVLRRRLARSFGDAVTFGQAWSSVCASHYEGTETSQFLIDRSLMRPRNLLKLVNYCKGFAVNLDHDRIEVDDITKGLRSYSNEIVLEADRELADVEPGAENLLYEFAGEPSEIAEPDLNILLQVHGLAEATVPRVVDYLLYLGFLGIRTPEEEPRYIYNFGYDLRILNAIRRKLGGKLHFVLNPAFWPALEIRSN